MNEDMNTIDDISRRYQHQVQQDGLALHKLQQTIYRIGTLRLLLFVAGVAGLIWLRAESWYILAGIVLVTLVPFLALIRYHNRLFYRKEYLEKSKEISEQELAALNYDISAFDDGKAYADPAHLYAFDLDVYGPHSLYQYLNRTCTQPGRMRLAQWLGQHLEEKARIEQRQEAVRELADAADFRRQFRITGLLHKGKMADEDELKAWAATPSTFRNHAVLRLLPALVTALNLACLCLVATDVLPGSGWAIAWCGCLAGSFCFTGRISRTQAVYGKKLQILGTYARLLHLMDERPMHCRALKGLKEMIGGEKREASYAIGRLDKLMNELDQRNNFLMYAVLNGTFCWELWQIMRIERWKEQHASMLPRWIEAIGEMDALNSLATFAYNHPDYVYPCIAEAQTEHDFCLQARQLGHPLMHRDRCVRNDVDICKRPYFLIITGANMAGKSTYLRTIGINYLLACIGAPVCATHMEVTPAKLVTSLRTTDSLTDNESYFFAELKRLKLIIDKLRKGEQLFIILDEIVKGTNSVDKQKGSLALVSQLMALQADGIIATHDLMLGTLAEHYPDNIRNCCFEADIANDELTFSYRLRPGVAQNMNACFLMKKMGIALTDEPHHAGIAPTNVT